ncbi:MAG: hypothetical protein ACRBFS_09705 [Aureispira sp.]
MFASAFAYLLTLFLAFTLIPLMAVFLRLLLIALFSRIYWLFNKRPAPAVLLQFSIKIAHPIGFLTSIFHGYIALWMGFVLLRGMDVPLDLFLPSVLTLSFFWIGMRRIKRPTKVAVNNRLTTTNSLGEETTIILNPEENIINPEENMFAKQQEDIKEQLKEKASEFMQGNTIIGLIGKLTGVLMATFNLILPHL